jgi:DeoR/GlpR family transcriptional regulator of sugar metabolism
VLTNGLRIATELAGIAGVTVAMPGGRVRWEALSLVGPLGGAVFDEVNVQKAFVGASGFTMESGLSDATEEEAQIKRLMVAAARQVIGIVDHTKWRRAAFATFCRLDRLHLVLADAAAPREMVDQVRQRGIDVRLISVPPPGTSE